mgnify:CR=1 FL=1
MWKHIISTGLSLQAPGGKLLFLHEYVEIYGGIYIHIFITEYIEFAI